MMGCLGFRRCFSSSSYSPCTSSLLPSLTNQHSGFLPVCSVATAGVYTVSQQCSRNVRDLQEFITQGKSSHNQRPKSPQSPCCSVSRVVWSAPSVLSQCRVFVTRAEISPARTHLCVVDPSQVNQISKVMLLARLLCSAGILESTRMSDAPVLGVKEPRRPQGWVLWGLFPSVVRVDKDGAAGWGTSCCLSQLSQQDQNCTSGRITDARTASRADNFLLAEREEGCWKGYQISSGRSLPTPNFWHRNHQYY